MKKTEVYQVSVAPDGQQQKTELSSSPAPAPPSGGRFKQRIVEKKKDEFQQYGQQVAALAKEYAHPDPQLLQQAYQKGNISLQMGGAAGTTSLVVKNYLKPGDQMTLVFNSAQKEIVGMNISSYLNDPSDAVTMTVQFAKLPSGVNHVAQRPGERDQQADDGGDIELQLSDGAGTVDVVSAKKESPCDRFRAWRFFFGLRARLLFHWVMMDFPRWRLRTCRSVRLRRRLRPNIYSSRWSWRPPKHPCCFHR